MRNYCKVDSDGICVYINTKVISAKIGVIILIIINLIAWPGYIYLATIIPVQKESGLIIPLIIFLLFLIFGLGRYTAWNLWGQEYIRINTKSINYFRSYGIISTNEKKIKIKRPGLSYEKFKTFDDIEYGKLYFYDYDEDNNPILVFETTILIQKEDAITIIKEIDLVHQNEYYDVNNIVPITMN